MTENNYLLKDYLFTGIIQKSRKWFPFLAVNDTEDKNIIDAVISRFIFVILSGIFLFTNVALNIIFLLCGLPMTPILINVFLLAFPLTMVLISNFKYLHGVRFKEENQEAKSFMDKFFSKVTDFDIFCSLLFGLVISGIFHYLSQF